MCYVQWNSFGQPKYFGFHFCWKTEETFGSGCSEPVFCFIVALLLTPKTITCTVWHARFAWKLISQDANSIKCTFVIVTSIEEMRLPFQFIKRKNGGKWSYEDNFFARQYISNCFFFSLLKRNCIYWDFVLKSHRKWSKYVTFCKFIVGIWGKTTLCYQ